MQSRGLDFSGRIFPRFDIVPKDVRRITWSRAIRWFGWGFGENLIPIFILTFSASITETGLVRSVYDIVFLLSLPLIGLLADVLPGKTLLIAALTVYPFIGLSYYLAGISGMILFIILARILNGVAYCLDSVGFDTYLRRSSVRGSIASAFGYGASVANFLWVIAAIAGVWLVRFVPIGTLLLLITPFSFLALVPLIHAKRDTPITANRLNPAKILKPLLVFLKEIVALRKGLRGVVFLMFSLDVASVAATFFIPIDAYRNGASLSAVAFLVVVSSVPSLFEFWLAEFIDGSKAKRRWALSASLVALPILFIGASMVTTLPLRILVALGIETAAIFGSLALQSYATTLSRRERYGEVSSVLEGASTLGDLAGPIALGLLADTAGFSVTFIAFAVLFGSIALFFLRRPVER